MKSILLEIFVSGVEPPSVVHVIQTPANVAQPIPYYINASNPTNSTGNYCVCRVISLTGDPLCVGSTYGKRLIHLQQCCQHSRGLPVKPITLYCTGCNKYAIRYFKGSRVALLDHKFSYNILSDLFLFCNNNALTLMLR